MHLNKPPVRQAPYLNEFLQPMFWNLLQWTSWNTTSDLKQQSPHNGNVGPFSKTGGAVPTVRMTLSTMLFLGTCITLYRNPTYPLNDIGSQMVRKFSETQCFLLKSSSLTNTSHYLHTKEQVKRIFEIIISRLIHYIAEHQQDRDT